MNRKKRALVQSSMLLSEDQFSCRLDGDITIFLFMYTNYFFPSLSIEWFRKLVVEGTTQTLSR